MKEQTNNSEFSKCTQAWRKRPLSVDCIPIISYHLILIEYAPPFCKYIAGHKRGSRIVWLAISRLHKVCSIKVATSTSTSIEDPPDLEVRQFQEQIQKVRSLRRNLKMNTEPSRLSGEDELYVGGYVHLLSNLCPAHVILFWFFDLSLECCRGSLIIIWMI